MNSFKKIIYSTAIENLCLNCTAHDVPLIGTQVWDGCNATVSTYRNGDTIPQVTDSTAWAALTTGAWCYYNNDPTTEAAYGKLYNWYAVNDIRGLAPVGYYMPTDAEWTVLTDYLGGASVAGGKMKEAGLCHWFSPNTDATNTSLFTALPGGNRDYIGNYNDIGNYGVWWSSTEYDATTAWFRYLVNSNGNADRNASNKKNGLSVRFLKGLPTITIGTQIWTDRNLDVATYANGDIIPQVTDPTTWATLTTGAWCYFNNDPANNAKYGKIYNWHAVNDIRGLAPIGYHVPTDAEWTNLKTYLGGSAVAGGKMKEVGLTSWNSPNTDATNTSLFTALPGGNRNSGFGGGGFFSFGNNGNWWTSTENGSSLAWFHGLSFNNGSSYRNNAYKADGFSVRLIKD